MNDGTELSVTTDDIMDGLRQVGVDGKRVIVHTALSAFGHVLGGAEAVVIALSQVAETVIVPTFTFSPAAEPPPDDRPMHNGTDYKNDRLGDEDPTPFTLDLPAAKAMGVVPEALRCRDGAVRSRHPLSSFAAIGEDADRYMADHDFDNPMLPLRRLFDDGGHVLMLGTDLTSCTTMHLGEEHAGRRPFIRWAKLEDGTIQRVRVGGCSDGFDRLEPWLEVQDQTEIGRARVRLYTVGSIVDATMRRLAEDRSALVCPARCRRCLDAAAGGPF
jgi:aminoglycoside 3-N-acetyltransferase